MTKPRAKTANELVTHGQLALHLMQIEMAELLGASRRTAQRWASKQSVPSADQLALLARHVYPVDHALAAEIATGAGTTLEALGVIARAPAVVPPPASALPPPPPAPPPPPPAQLVENILYAAADAMNVPPAAVLPAVRAAFARAQQLAIDVVAVNEVLSGTRAASTATPAKPPRQRGGRPRA